MAAIVEARNVTKRFPGVLALDKVCLRIEAGKVNALVGENGAGKSTLMNIISGVYTDYEGEILVDGQVCNFSNVTDAQEKGIAIIHQELNHIPYMNIAENMFLGREPLARTGVIDYSRMHKEAKEQLKRLHLDIDTHTLMADLRVGQQQLVEIGKALMLNAKALIMDEPTSSLSESETQTLFSIIEELKGQGAGIVYISHKMNEVWQLADFITIMRDGKLIAEKPMTETTADEVVSMMVGRESEERHVWNEREKGDIALEVKNLSMRNPESPNRLILNDISFNLHKGEVLGIYGLMGAGRTELLECLFGLHPKLITGQIYVNGSPASIKHPSDAVKHGIALCPEDRKREGLVLGMSIRKNVTLAALKKITKYADVIRHHKEKTIADEYRQRLVIKSYSAEQLAEQLSGGNQQKIVLGKWIMTQPKILFLDEPTRGIDINAKHEIYHLIDQMAAQGIAVIVVSSELPEIMAVSDRIITMRQGRIGNSFLRSEFTEESILKASLPQ